MPDTWVGLFVALLAVVPGFLAVTTWARARTWKGPSGDLRTILQSLAISAVVQVVIFPATVFMILPYRTDPFAHPWLTFGWLVGAVLVVPLALGLGAARLTDWLFPLANPPEFGKINNPRDLIRWLMRPAAPPCLWDWWMSDARPNGQFVLAKLRDGSYVGGVFSDGSMALTSPEPHGLFLASEWIVDGEGDFIAPIPKTGGLLLPLPDDVLWIRVQGDKPTTGGADGNQV